MDKAAAALARMKGPVVPLNLCFDESGALDHQAVAAYVDWLSEQGAPILMLTYGSSEFACLDDEDIWAVTETVGQACAGRAFCIGGTGFWKAAKTRDYLAHAQAVGMDAVKVQVHPYLGNTTPVLVNYFDALAGAADIPLLLWAGGQPPFPLEAAVELAQRPHIIGMKNDGDQFYTYYDLIRQTRNFGFGVISRSSKPCSTKYTRGNFSVPHCSPAAMKLPSAAISTAILYGRTVTSPTFSNRLPRYMPKAR